MSYTEIRDKGYKELEIYVQLIAEAIDIMQKADVPVPIIKEKLRAELETVTDKASKEQMERWMDVQVQ